MRSRSKASDTGVVLLVGSGKENAIRGEATSPQPIDAKASAAMPVIGDEIKAEYALASAEAVQQVQQQTLVLNLATTSTFAAFGYGLASDKIAVFAVIPIFVFCAAISIVWKDALRHAALARMAEIENQVVINGGADSIKWARYWMLIQGRHRITPEFSNYRIDLLRPLIRLAQLTLGFVLLALATGSAYFWLATRTAMVEIFFWAIAYVALVLSASAAIILRERYVNALHAGLIQ